MRNSRSISIDDIRQKGPLGAVTASKEETFGLKGALLVTCRQSGLGLDALKEALRLTIRERKSAAILTPHPILPQVSAQMPSLEECSCLDMLSQSHLPSLISSL
jgi:hypothetical protein